VQLGNARAQSEIRSILLRCSGERFRYLSVTLLRIEEPSGSRWLEPRNLGQDFSHQLSERSGRDSTPGLNSRERVGISAPDLSGVGEIEIAADGGSQIGQKDTGEAVSSSRLPAQGFSPHVGERAQGELRIQPQHQIEGLEREVDELPPQVNSAMSRPIQQVVPEQVTNLRQNLRVACRVQAVASVVQPLASGVEAAGVSTNNRILLDHGDLGPCGSCAASERRRPRQGRRRGSRSWVQACDE
jgi:hypothetical protein